jgi:diguanylate cyclase (GGDEF)-like protein
VSHPCSGKCGGKCATSAVTCSELCNGNYATVKSEIDTEIDSLIADLSDLYAATMTTNDEYNQYLGASYISVLSSASVRSSVNVMLYTIIAFVFLIVLCCGGAIVVGRLGDIVQYVFYTDHLTELANRAYFDKYLKSMDKKLLDDGTVYAVVEIDDLAGINNTYSRQTGDDLLKLFTRYLKEAFGKTEAEFIYNGNGSFIVLVDDSDYITVEDVFKLFSIRFAERDELTDVNVTYKVGIAETFKETQTARKLLALALQNKKDF